MPERVALITGGSRGIGFELARRLGARGMKLAIASRQPEEAVRALEEEGFTALSVPLDLAEEDPEPAVHRVLEHYGRLDVLAYSAGANVRKPALELSLEEWRLIQRVNLEAAFLTARACAPRMLEQRYGRMLFVASIQSFHGGSVLNVSAYGAAKAGLVGLTRQLAKEWAPGGIRVNAICPGFTRTELTTPVYSNPELEGAITARIPVGRWAEAGEIAAAAAFLCSEEAEYITGQALIVDGGYLIY